MSEHIATTEARLEGFYWVILGRNPPKIAYWERGERWLAGDPKPWRQEAVAVASERLGVQAAVGAGHMMVRGGWRYDDDDPPPSRPLYLAAVFLVAAWVTVLLSLLILLILRLV